MKLPNNRLCAMRYIACIFLVAACAADDAPERVAVRDSAGVTIVENSTLALESAPTWSLSPQPELTIGVLGVDRSGRLWVKSYRRPGQEGPDTWLVFDPQGALAGRIELPEETRVLEVAEDDRVLAVVEDELDVQRVVVYTLTRTES